MGLWAVIAGTFAGRKHPSLEGMTHRFLRGRNGRPHETPPSPVRNPNVWKNSHRAFMRRRRERLAINPRPATNFNVSVVSVMWRPAVWVELSGLESTDDEIFVDGNAGVDEAAVCPPGKSVGKESGFHLGEIKQFSQAFSTASNRCRGACQVSSSPIDLWSPLSFLVASLQEDTSWLLSLVPCGAKGWRSI